MESLAPSFNHYLAIAGLVGHNRPKHAGLREVLETAEPYAPGVAATDQVIVANLTVLFRLLHWHRELGLSSKEMSKEVIESLGIKAPSLPNVRFRLVNC